MNKYFLLIMTAWVCSCAGPENANAQPTWTVGNTTLTETDLVTGITRPWEILWGPDDYIWCTLRTGEVLHIDPLTGNYTEILDLSNLMPNSGGGEPGMLGMALHPDFANTPKVYIVYCYTQSGVKERLVSFDWNGTSLINETNLINAIPGANIHTGSRLVISPDNKIMMSTGDKANGDLAQDLGSLNGKILRINLDGSIPADNPDPTSYVWSFGHRNGQGLCYGPTGILYESEHGQNNSDELNIIEPNRNYGWPEVEGACNSASEQTFCADNNVMEPITEWSPCVAVNGLSYYDHPAVPEWNNCLIMGVMGGLNGTSASNDRVSILHLSSDGLSIESEDKLFTTLNQRFRDVCINPYTGSLYVALNGTSYPGTTPNKIKEFRNMSFTSVAEPAKTVGQKMDVFPNPARDSFNLEVSPTLVGSNMSIYSYDGRMMKEVTIRAARETIPIEDLPSGNYWIIAHSNLGSVTRNFVKE
jgi:aldose sugar dehydrogenase